MMLIIVPLFQKQLDNKQKGNPKQSNRPYQEDTANYQKG